MSCYFVVYKPFGMLSQFTQEVEGQSTLADLPFRFPSDVYPVGRLDADSEGLLLLTNDKALNARLLQPERGHPRTYWVQTEGIPDAAACTALQQGVVLRIQDRSFRTRPAEVQVLPVPPVLPDRHPPVRYRKSVPDTWLALTLTEGKNRQVRRMCAAVGHPVLRLVRVRIGLLTWGSPPLGQLAPGEVRSLPAEAIRTLLGASPRKK